MTRLAFAVQERTHGKRGPRRVDLDRADRLTLAARRAVVHEIAQLIHQLGSRLTGLDLRVVDTLDERTEGDVLVARVEHHSLDRMVHGADLFALAAAGAGLDVLEQGHERLPILQLRSVDVVDESVEGESERLAGQLALGQLAGVEDVLRVHDLLVVHQRLDLFLAEERDLGDTDAVLTRNLTAHLENLGHDFIRGFVGRGEHFLVVGVDGQVNVTVAITGMHVVGYDDALELHILPQRLDFTICLRIGVAQLEEQEPTLGFLLGVGEILGCDLAVKNGAHTLKGLGYIRVFVVDRFNGHDLFQRGLVDFCQVDQVQVFEEVGEIRNDIHGDDDVLVDLEAGSALGNGRQLVAVFPEQLGFLLVAGAENIHTLIRLGQGDNGLACRIQCFLIVGIQLQDKDGNRVAFVLRGFGLILDGLYILGAELFKGGNLDQITLVANLVAQTDHVLDDVHGVDHGSAVEFEAQDAGVCEAGVADEAGFGDDTINAFLLHTGQAAQVLVGNVFAQLFATDVVAAQADGVDLTTVLVEYLEYSGICFVDFVTRMILAAYLDQVASGGDHAVVQDIVDGSAVLKGERATSVFRNVTTQRRTGLGSRVHGQQQVFLCRGLDGVQRDDTGLDRDGFVLCIDVENLFEAGQRQNDVALCGRNGTAGRTGSATAGDDAESKLIGQSDDASDLGFGLGEKNQQRQFHTQVGGVCG